MIRRPLADVISAAPVRAYSPLTPRNRSRLCLLGLIALIVVGLGAASASAHPLGNFTTNQLVRVGIDEDRAQVSYVLDLAEIPTFQLLQRYDATGTEELDPATAAEIEAMVGEEVGSGLTLTADGSPVKLSPAGEPAVVLQPGQGDLDVLRAELAFTGALPTAVENVELENDAFAGRRGWTAIQAVPGEGTDVVSSVPATDPTDGLRIYPSDLLSSPVDERVASFQVSPGDGGLRAPEGREGGAVAEGATSRADDGFASTLAGADTEGTLIIFLLVAAFGWGALHALSPGHGKAMVAGYLVGARGTPRHAVILGLTVTATHTASVFALGVITLAASQYIVPEDLYPWLSVASGLLVVGIGLSVMRSRFRRWRLARAAATSSEGDHGHSHDHHHGNDHHGHGDGAHSHDHVHAAHDAHGHSHGHDHDHSHMPEGPITMRSLLSLGVSGGLVPCPSALVVLIAAISQQRLGFGMLLIFVFSLGLAATLTAVGLAVIFGGRAVKRFRPEKQLFGGRLIGAVPALSASIIVVAGVIISLRALPETGLI